MLHKLIITAAAALALSIGNSQAEGSYYGGSVAFLDYSEGSNDLSLTSAFGRLGTSFNDNFSGELRLGLGIGDDTVSEEGFDASVELETLLGGYFRAGFPVAESFFPYAVVGYSRIELAVDVEGFGSDSGSETDVSYGAGADFSLNEKLKINVEYMNYFDKNGAEISGFSIGLAASF